MRLDLYLYEQGFAQSRNKAAELIKERLVQVDEKIVTKPSFEVDTQTNKISVDIKKQYVSRAAHKLKGFLNQHKDINIEDMECLDIGSSTGGFAQILLEKKAKKVTCVDVGQEQLHPLLKDEKRIELFEKTDIRKFQADKTYDVITCDVSFISVEQILEDILSLSHDKVIILFKPQFEVGKEIKRSKKGVIKDDKAIAKVMKDFEAKCFAKGLDLQYSDTSIIKGKEGNEEIFYSFTKR